MTYFQAACLYILGKTSDGKKPSCGIITDLSVTTFSLKSFKHTTHYKIT